LPAVAGQFVPQAPPGKTAYSLRSILSSSFASIFNTVFPSDCRLCGEPLTNVSRLPVCADCTASIKPIEGSVCEVCGERVPDTSHAVGETKCMLCRRARLPFAKAMAYGSYSGALRGMVHLLKYESMLPAAESFATLLAPVIQSLAELCDAEALLVPVPLYKSKQRQREFNQSELIARAVLRRMPSAKLKLADSVLVRQRDTRSQTGLTRHQRRENMRGAFAVRDASLVAGRDIILIDDVLTTGTTAAECARVLRRAGAKKVYVATVARVMKGEQVSVELAKSAEA
jgi:ComF family protein